MAWKRTTHWTILSMMLLFTAGIVSIPAHRVHSRWSQSLVLQSQQRAIRSAQAFADAAASWVQDESAQHLIRSATLMLQSDAVAVRIAYNGDVLLEQRAQDWEGERFADVASLRLNAVSAVDRLRGCRILSTTAPIIESGIPIGYVFLATRALALESNLRQAVLLVALWGTVLWISLSGTLGFAAMRWMKRSQQAQTLEPSLVPDGFREHLMPHVLTVDPKTKTVSYNGTTCVVTPKPFSLLALLGEDRDKVYSTAEIIRELWSDGKYTSANDLHQCVYRLRRSLDEMAPGLGSCVANVKGFGYRLDFSQLPPHGTQQRGLPENSRGTR